MIKVSSLSVKYDSLIIDGVDLNFEAKKIYGIIGRSGSGKTTLLKAISGLVDLDSGEVLFEGKLIQGPSERLIPGYDEIQLVNQDFGLDLYHTVYENVKEKVLSRDKHLQEELIEEYLELVELKSIKDRKVKVLSGGEQQRLAIARALACEPKVLLLDEPFVHLDQRLRWKILHYLNDRITDYEMVIIIVSHDGAEMMGFADEVIHIENKQIVRKDSAIKLYYNPQSKSQAELLGVVNEVQIKGCKMLFRPNEYSLENADFEVEFKSSIDIGITVLNYFVTVKKEQILLYGQKEMNNVSKIKITK